MIASMRKLDNSAKGRQRRIGCRRTKTAYKSKQVQPSKILPMQ